jgi:hypothetical protein
MSENVYSENSSDFENPQILKNVRIYSDSKNAKRNRKTTGKR